MADTQLLCEMIESALLKGATRAVIEIELERQAKTNGQPIPTKAEINEAYAEIVEHWISDANQDEEKIYAYHVRIRKHLYQKSFALNDFKTCLAIASDLAAIEDRHKTHLAKSERARLQAKMMGAGNK
jgi:hypothetical protein